ncbi:MAG TPA: TVP38/TMEM64 family protein [Usitatibacter sp.]|nr:TVP38/TMEM64 family protein [Usitatibacter sp.]
MKKPRHLAWLIGTAAVIAIVGVGMAMVLPMADWEDLFEEKLETWVHESGGFGALVFTGVYVVATLFLLPAVPLNVAAGALFGMYWGVSIVMAASTSAAVIAFLVARYLLRERIKKHYARKGMSAAIDKALRSEGWKAVALLRLSPVVPFAVKSYLFGVSAVRLRDYVIGTVLGKLPGAIVLTALGTTGRAAMDLSGAARWSLMAAGIAATVLVSWLIGRAAKKRLGL